MFICPVTGRKLIKARAGGSSLWYSPDTNGRMLTLATARDFFGENRVREIWMRSELSPPETSHKCPYCQKGMRTPTLPQWVGTETIEVCRVCRIFWIPYGYLSEVPVGHQLINKYGDSTLVKDLGDAYLAHN